ncbi:MAG: PKD domain-containing protein [bacterium]|nr:PKD domain-containing protein [bacterium]
MKLKHIGVVAALAILLPFATSAISIDDLQQQIANLLAQVTRLQEQLKLLQTTPPVITPPSLGRICPHILRTLNQGISGSDVSDLQAYLGVSQTGFFGPLTARAVAKFQANEGLSQVGIVGPQTRAAFARRCGQEVSPPQPPIVCTEIYPICGTGYHVGGYCNNQCIADSTSAGAPSISGLDAPTSLSVGQSGTWTVRASVPNQPNSQLSYSVTWGDEVTSPYMLNSAQASAPPLRTNAIFTHTYQSAGTFSPTFTVSNSSGSAKTSASVTVGGTISTAFSASPMSGNAPLTVSFSAAPGGNVGNNEYTVDFGDGASGALVFPLCNLGSTCTGKVTHTYTSAGTYTTKLRRTPDPTEANCYGANCWVIGTVTITVTGSTSQTFSASPTSGSAPLVVSFSGTVNSAGYSIDFGDGTSSGDVRCGHGGCPTSPSSSSVNTTHTYNFPGTYTAKLRQHFSIIAGNCAGVDCNVVGTVMITVSGQASGAFRVVSLNGGEMLMVGQPVAIRWNTDGSALGGHGQNVVTLSLVPQNPGYKDERQLQIANVRASDLSFTWTPLGSLAGDSYRIRAMLSDGMCLPISLLPYGGPVCMAVAQTLSTDESDGWFSITTDTQTGTFSASPTSGTAPLAVTFSNMIGGPLQGSLVIRYGDGSTDAVNRCREDSAVVADTCVMPGINTHTYTTAGTFMAKLVNVTCIGTGCEKVWGTATITVDGSGSGQTIIKTVGEQEGSFLIQKINPDSVDGLWYQAYPISNGVGTPKTLHIGDNIGYACEGVTDTLTSIDYYGQKVTFAKVVGQPTYGGCPICLASNTKISTPTGELNVKDIKAGTIVWSQNARGEKIATPVIAVSHTPVPSNHQVIHVVFSDGREVWVSPGHPAADGLPVSQLRVGDSYDDSRIQSLDSVTYWDTATYDILPNSTTGFYWANGVLLGSTLHHSE